MSKKLISLLLVIAMFATLLAGCAAPAAPAAEEAAPAEETAPAEKPAAGGSVENADLAIAAADFDASEVYTKDNNGIVIGMTLLSYEMTFFHDMLAQARATAEELGVEIIDYDGGADITQQANAVNDLISQNVNALFLNPIDGDAIGGVVAEANNAGIPIVSIDVRVSSGDIECHVSSNNIQIGEEAAKAAVEYLVKKNGSETGTIYVLGYDPMSTLRDRTDGFIAYMDQYPNITCIKEEVDTNVAEVALAKVESALQTYAEGELDVIFGACEAVAVGSISAAEAAGRKDIIVIGVDDAPTLNAALADPDNVYYCSIVQQPMEMGRIGVELCTMAAQGMEIDPTYISTPLLVVTKDNIGEYESDLNARKAELAQYYD